MKAYVLGIGFEDLLVLEVHLSDGLRWLVVNPNEEKMVEDGAYVARPMQEKLEEDFRHKVETCLDAKIDRKEAIVIVY